MGGDGRAKPPPPPPSKPAAAPGGQLQSAFTSASNVAYSLYRSVLAGGQEGQGAAAGWLRRC